ncbi:hypothetical protein SVAN01_01611 [Stagonosporopsis vannaccii]|nr:hypothetical protein SVAN01_01611 [Stagonosporopsis vannaccii]
MYGRATPPRHSPYPGRRSRHACENCRRKKTKCPGQRPKCSVCDRLNQQCVYAHAAPAAAQHESTDRSVYRQGHHGPQTMLPGSSMAAERLTAIEARLEQIAAGLGNHQAEQSSQTRSIPSAHVRHDLAVLDMPSEAVSDGILAYFMNHCNQPCPLFDHLLAEPLEHRYHPMVLTAMLALTLCRSSRGETIKSARCSSQSLAQRSWDLLADSYRRFEIDDAYFQALVLLAQVDFAEGRSERARTQVALGLRLAQSRGMLGKEHYQGENESGCKQHQEIVYSLCILDRMFTSRDIPNSSIPQSVFRLPAYQGGPKHPEHNGRVDNTSTVQNCIIVDAYVQMMHMWELVTRYISESLTGVSQPIWHHKSVRSAILTRNLELEIPMEPHTYASVGPVARVHTEPHLRSYFQTWMFFQITHSAIHCCINHPFLLFIIARRHGSRVPLTFLQKAHKESLLYASWIAKSLTDMETASLNVIDPFLAYLVGIAASIHIEHSLSSNASIASSAREKIRTCMAYLTRVSRVWPKVEKRIIALEELRSSVGSRSALNYVEDEYDGAVPVRSVRHVSMSPVDERNMWLLFDSSNDSVLDTSSSVEGTNGNGPGYLGTSEPLAHQNSHDTANSILQSPGNFQHVSTVDTLASEIDPAADWSLLGMPWFAYFPPDADLLSVNDS